jgi:hypothetical protein
VFLAKVAVAVAATLVGAFVYARSAATVEKPRPASPVPAPNAGASRPVAVTTVVPQLPAPAPVPAPPPAAPQAPPGSLEDLVARVNPTVVVIETSGSRGSGLIVQPDTIVTNAHVAGANVTVRVRRYSGETVTARVETVARDLDLALLRLNAPIQDQPTASLGSVTGVRSGQEVVAIGSALGVLQNTVTRGIVSGVRQAGGVTLIQTDAAINPGNSGGPLVDRQGNVIGINTMGVLAAHGISFAVAVDHVRELLGGQHTAVATDTPASTLNQALSARTEPDPDASRERATHAYDDLVGQLARKADALDDYWRRFRASCYHGPIAGTFDREWFALFEARTMQGAVADACSTAFADVRQQANAVRDAVVAAEEGARRADVYPGTRRDILRKYRLDYPAWHP